MYGLKTDGTLHKKYITQQNMWITPATDGKLLYFGSGDGNFYAFDIITGKLMWKFSAKLAVYSSPWLEKGKLYFGGWNGNLYSLSTKGELLWSYRLKMSSPAPLEAEEELQGKTESQVTWTPEITQESKDKYKSQLLGTESGQDSTYVMKSEYVIKSKYTQKRRIKSMSSGWED